MTTLRELPSVEQILQTQTAAELIADFGRPLTLGAIRSALEGTRTRFKPDSETALPSIDMILAEAESQLFAWAKGTLVPVINATGVLLHTNLGRAPLSDAAIRAIDAVSRGYSNLEYDLEKGVRGSRSDHAEAILQKLSGAEAALVVNNNASAVLLVLSALANKKRVVISRSQLVEIGGGFRIPDVMKQSGARLVEVGTTNKTHLADYEEQLSKTGTLIMRVHPSNFKVIGFTEEPLITEITGLGHKYDALVLDDLGSGALIDTAKFGLAHEPTVLESVAAGVDVICFSGDKLLGGPQAGIIVGRKDLLEKIKKHPLARAVRADKACLAGLTATLLHYLKDEAEREIPLLKMMSLSAKQIQGRAEALAQELGHGEVVEGQSTVGGGSLPGETFKTYLLSLAVKSPDKILKKLRGQKPSDHRTNRGR